MIIICISARSKALNLECLDSKNSTCVVKQLQVTKSGEKIKELSNHGQPVEEFYVYDLTMKFFPSNLGHKVPALKTVKILRSKLAEISMSDFMGLESLKVLSLGQNELKMIESDAFNYLHALAELDLNNNNLVMLKKKTFGRLRELKSLNLDSNDLKEIDADLFRHNVKLEFLSIRDNYLKELPTFVFKNLDQLRELKLDENELAGLQDELFSKNKNLELLTASNNEIAFIGKENQELFVNLKEQDFLHSPCTQTLKQGYSAENLRAVMDEFCKMDDKTQIKWLTKNINEVRRFKREDENALKCFEEEMERNELNINQTSDYLASLIKDTKEEIVDLMKTTEAKNSKSEISEKTEESIPPKIDGNKLESTMNEVKKEILESVDGVSTKVKAELAPDFAAIPERIKKDFDERVHNLETKLLGDIAVLQQALNNAKTFHTAIKEEVKTNAEKILSELKSEFVSNNNKDNVKLVEAVNAALKDFHRCDYYGFCFELTKVVIKKIKDEKKDDVFVALTALKTAIDSKTDKYDEPAFKDYFDDADDDIDSFKSKVEEHCGITVTF